MFLSQNMAHIFQINISDGGVPKLPVRETVLTENGLVGDRQRDLHYHGGVMRAVCLFSLELILALQAEGHTVYPGSTGENLTIAGLDWKEIEPGCQLALGNEVLIEITSHAGPCKNIAASFIDGEFKRISHKVNPHWSRLYAKVLNTGKLVVGQEVSLSSVEKSANRAV